jgi:hypothetical protein
MKKTLELALVSFSLLYSGLNGALHAQSYIVNAQITSQAIDDGTYDYTIQLNNDSSSTASIGEFWFAWVPDSYSYDLLTSAPTSIVMPADWSDNVVYNPYDGYYGPDGYSIQFFAGTPLAPGATDTFGFSSADSPATLAQNSTYYPVSTLTSYVYDSSGYDYYGSEILVTPAAVPEPSIVGLLGICAVGLLLAMKRRMPLLKQSAIAR